MTGFALEFCSVQNRIEGENTGAVVHESQFRDQQVMTNWSNPRVRKLGHDPGHQVVMKCQSS
jgi:hypothetical protein